VRDLASFIRYVEGECAYAGVRFRLEARKRNRAGELGFFNEDDKILFACGIGDEWPMVLAHELSHLHQWHEKKFVWPEDRYNAMLEWCAGTKRMTAAKALQWTRDLQLMELDAERRTLKLARTFHLSDDPVKYIQGANMYVWKYEVARQLQRWPKYTDAVDPTVLGAMPTKLMPPSQIANPPELMLSLAKE
jgi:hypothetical protein